MLGDYTRADIVQMEKRLSALKDEVTSQKI